MTDKSTINKWGPSVWTFLHSLVENINSNFFPEISETLLLQIKKICVLLPCPICSKHAESFLKSVNYKKMRTKKQFKEMLLLFHNSVNERNSKPIFLYDDLTIYEKINMRQSYINFRHNMLQKYAGIYLTKSFHLKLFFKNFELWFQKYKHVFAK